MRGKVYADEERMAYVEEFKSSGQSVASFCRDRNIPETTLRDWLKLDRNLAFGEIALGATSQENQKTIIKQPMIFVGPNMRIELKEGFNKQFLRKIVEVLINDN